jgi:hypothetical protein
VLTTTRRSLRRLGARLGRWPRRIACLVCLLFAAGTALSPKTASTPADSHRPADQPGALRSDQVAVPVAVDRSGTAMSVRAGDRVGVLAGASTEGFVQRSDAAVLVADHLRVLAVQHGDNALGDESSVTVVVAASRANAVRIAGFSDRSLLLIADGFP